jgi:hypothetical protein
MAAEIDFKFAWAADWFAVILARKRPGMATAASNAMIATTIMISTSVKPFFTLVFFILVSFLKGIPLVFYGGLSLFIMIYYSAKMAIIKKLRSGGTIPSCTLSKMQVIIG